MKSLHLVRLAYVFALGVFAEHARAVDATGQKAIGFGIAKRTQGFVTSTANEKLRGPGVVAVLERGCLHSMQLEDSLARLGVPYTPLYVDDDLDLYNAMVSGNEGQIPSLYKDGRKIPHPIEFLKAHKDELINGSV